MRFLTKSGDGSIEYFADDRFLFAKKGADVFKLAIFENGYHKLRLFNGVPVLEMDGLRMQLVKGFKSPLDYPKEVAKLLFKSQDRKPETGHWKQTTGNCLDTCTGLGYTAIEASKYARSVVTCEISEAVLSLAHWNPWSERLFDNRNVEIIHGDISSEVKKMKSGRFDKVIHDPPRFSRAGNLYSLDFYQELYRVMKKKGRIFHYIGSVGKGKGRRISAEVSKRLKDAGFRNIRSIKRLQGLLAEK